MFGACAFWGLMAPLGKDAMTHGLDGLTMVSFRVLGGCLLFWLTSLFVKKEHVPSQPIPTQTWLEAGYVVVFGTYVGYILTMIGQKTLRPTVVSVYNYVQHIISVVVSVLTGIGVLKPTHALAVILVFSGVWLVTKSRSRADMKDLEKA